MLAIITGKFAGGPGSRKGIIIGELATQFNFTSLNIENIIFDHLANKLSIAEHQCLNIQKLIEVFFSKKFLKVKLF